MTFWHWTTLILLLIVLGQNGFTIARWIIGMVRQGKQISKP